MGNAGRSRRSESGPQIPTLDKSDAFAALRGSTGRLEELVALRCGA
jgi:hypothetical protein